MTITDDMVEIGARALAPEAWADFEEYSALKQYSHLERSEMLAKDKLCQQSLQRSRQVLAAALEGSVAVPREPTAEMLCAAVPFPLALVIERDDPQYTAAMEYATTLDRLAFRSKYLAAVEALALPRQERGTTI